MRLALLIPGTGHFYCGSCLRDDALGKALRRRGHDVTMVPLYLPLVLEEPAGPPSRRVLMGGINMYLQQKAPIFGRLPRWLTRALDAPGLLRWASRRGDMTDAAGLGAMTLSMLEGEHGRQARELERLVAWMRTEPPPDLICLSNLMLAGMARRLKQALGVPLVCALQGEMPFLDALPEGVRERAWETVARRAGDVDAFIAVSHDYAQAVGRRIGVAREQLHVVHNGIELDGLTGDGASPAEPTIGYLARMCPDKGLHTLVDAFCLLKRRDGMQRVKLRVAGALLSTDAPYMERQKRTLEQAGVADDAVFLPNVSRRQKLAFLHSLSVLSVPATYGESFGLYVLEALAAGVPVVQPRHGAFPEIIEATGGGLLCEPDDAAALAEGLDAVLRDPERARALATRGRRSVRERFTSDHMARGVEHVCLSVLEGTRQP